MLEIKNLSKSFETKQIFRDFSYSFPKIGLYVIKGNSGIGKTTLLRIISGIDKKYNGSVLGGGFKNVSFAFQEYRLFPTLTALENITDAVWDKPDKNNVSEAKKILLSLGFAESDLSLFPHELSGGMKQRISLARAFLRKAPILILDEPTKELDASLSAKIVEMIRKEAEHRLVLMVTHTAADISDISYIAIDLDKI